MPRRDLAFVDVETTGLDPSQHEIIEICVVRENADGETRTFYTKIHPEHLDRADPEALRVNGYSDELWRSSPGASEPLVGELRDILRDTVVVGHNVEFDLAFIKPLWESFYTDYPSRWIKIDTTTLVHEHLMPCGLKSYRLVAVREFLGWSLLDAHTADRDVSDTRRLYHLLMRATVFHRLWWTLRAWWNRRAK
jgi:DNA polymerase III subunit epsilon